jgi:serine/threonine-protein kinase
VAAAPDAVALAGPHVRRLISSGSVPAGGFTPGTILLGRYRIIGLLGRGGMGEVYRADDLKLGQAVALKFLPPALAEDPVRRERFFAEVRITRQVSHPNICRVYDIAELEDPSSKQPRYFLTMEYIDGEDLASLLQRIGYLSNDKANDIARQLVAGLAAAHDRGVLHRDLKPANIMLDGQGRVRITDFGLAVAMHDEAAADVSGTPAYMAPEQLAGKGATVRSEIYALGLVLYELYTGRRLFTATTLPEIRDAKEHAAPVPPSELRDGMDPAVDRLIVRCIASDPRLRPASASQLAAALPGGDPLAAAIAAGETPSPEMVAAAGETDGLSVRAVVACAVMILSALPPTVMWMARMNPLLAQPLPMPPDVLAATAQQVKRTFGYTTPAAESVYGLESDDAYLNYQMGQEGRYLRYRQGRSGNDSTAPGPKVAAPTAVRFWYRESPASLQNTRSFTSQGKITPGDPAPIVSGMVGIVLDSHARLREFYAVPPEVDRQRGDAAVDWRAAFAAAALDYSRFAPTEPEWLSIGGSDHRAAWLYDDAGSGDVRVEAASWRGRPVFFRVIQPWTALSRMPPIDRSPPGWFAAVLVALVLLPLTFVFVLTRNNLRKRRADLRGAARLAAFVCAIEIAAKVVTTPTLYGGAGPLVEALFALPFALFYSAIAWVAYVAIEPQMRRRWPEFMISWSRLLGGQLRDPLVGSHILLGILCGLLMTVLSSMNGHQTAAQALLGPRAAAGEALRLIRNVLLLSSIQLVLFFGLRLVLKRPWLAAMVFSVVPFFLGGGMSAPLPLGRWMTALSALLFAGLLLRFGVLAAIVCLFTIYMIKPMPMTTDVSAWYAASTWLAIITILSLTGFATRTALAGRRVLRDGLLDA